ncbi:MAG TPA: EAL domain-containing protein [Geomonas sp.]|nr:EAL domain-containing protein [Geomonas sp.]
MDAPLDSAVVQRALVVDDEPMVRMLARATLEKAGFVVEEAQTGDQAISLIEQSMPDLILLDVLLPGVDGFSVCQHLNRLLGDQPYAVVMMTGLDDHDSIQKAYEVGATDFVIKPINWQVLGYRAKYIARANQAVKDLHSSEARLKYAQQVARLGSWEWLVDNDVFIFSEIINQIFEIEGLQLRGSLQSFLDLVHPSDREYVRSVFEETVRNGAPFGIDTRILIGSCGERFVHIEAGVVTEKGNPRRLSGTVQDITERKVSENQIRSLAYYDILTGLANRLQFNESLEAAIAAAVAAGRKVALIFLDLDRFKFINDTLGHDAGDLLLKQVATRLKHCLRKGDCVTRDPLGERYDTVSRLGGDEFTIVLENIASDQDAAKVARRIIEDVEKPIELMGREVFVTASLGISLFPDDGANALSLIKNADSAMYHAKALGANNFQFYSSSMNDSAVERLAMEGELRKALERNEFLLCYQPQIDTVSGAMVAVEALVRWQHPERGVVSPGVFIPLAEESGLITAIDNWVMTTACRQIRSWQDAGISPVRVAVNLSGRDFMQNKVLSMVNEALEVSGIDPGYLELEITEGVLMKKADETIQTLNALKAMGLKLSIDDFGTGYSSLSYLQRFPLDMLKIDRSFVSDVTSNGNSAAIVTAIIALAFSLSLDVLAEGVETAEQQSFLQSHGCSRMQGYLFSTPQTAEAIEGMLKNAGAGRG